MDRQISLTKVLWTIGWFLFRLTFLNGIILTLTFILSVTRNIFEPTDTFVIEFPFQLYVTALFLTNLVYIIGNLFETIYLRLWSKKIEIREFEGKFFKGGLVMTIFVHVIGVVMYFVNYFN